MLVAWAAPTQRSKGVGKELSGCWREVLNLSSRAEGQSPYKFSIFTLGLSLKCQEISQIQAWKVLFMVPSQLSAHDVL